jgi:hypothetical protein
VVDVHGEGDQSPSDRHVAGPGEQRLVQCCPVQGQAGAHTIPQVGHVDVDKDASAVVGNLLALDPNRMPGHLGAQAEVVQRPYRVARQEDAGALGRRGGRAFDDLDCGSPPAQCASRGQAGDASADDEDTNTGSAHRRTSTAFRCPNARRRPGVAASVQLPRARTVAMVISAQ